jgi:hypothetical protein
VAIVVLGCRSFVSLCPAQAVRRHLVAVHGQVMDPEGEVVDASFRVLDE